MGSADCVATRLLARKFYEPQQALRTSAKGSGVHEAATGDCTKVLRRPKPPFTNPQGLHEGLRKSHKPTRTANCRPHKVVTSFVFALRDRERARGRDREIEIERER